MRTAMETMPEYRRSLLAAVLRRIYRGYRNQPLCVGHGLMRRAFAALIGPRQRVVLANGLRLDLDLNRVVQNTIFWLDGDVEPALEWVVRELVPPCGTMVDCGANCGFIGLLTRRLRRARVLFVEPHPRLAAAIRRNLELNGWSGDCVVVEAAASDAEGEIVLHEHPRQDGSHSVHKDWVEDGFGAGGEIRVEARTLGSVLAGLPGFERIDFLKVDTEGHDLAVLRGLGEALRPERIRAVYVELGRQREEGFRLLQGSGYEGFGVRILRRRALNRLRRGQSRGEPVAYFHPWSEGSPPPAETLWVPRGGPAAAFLSGVSAEGSRDSGHNF